MINICEYEFHLRIRIDTNLLMVETQRAVILEGTCEIVVRKFVE